MERMHILVCAGTGCTSSLSAQVVSQLNVELAKLNLEKEVKVIKTGCFGLCQKGPIVAIHPEIGRAHV